MSEAKRIEDQLRRAFEGEAWVGPSLSGLLEGVDTEKALTRIVAGAHSIWEIVLHIASWERIARQRVEGKAEETVSPTQDWPPVTDPSPAAWDEAKGDLERENLRLRETIAGLDDERLQEVVPGRPYTVYGLLHGVIQHDLYHAGQIALLKKDGP